MHNRIYGYRRAKKVEINVVPLEIPKNKTEIIDCRRTSAFFLCCACALLSPGSVKR